MPHLRPSLATGILSLAIAGCSTVPGSLIDGNPGHPADSTLFPVRVVSVDGQLLVKTSNGARPVAPSQRRTPGFHYADNESEAQSKSDRTKLEMSDSFQTTPGTHEVVLQFAYMQKSFILPVQPCTAYHLGARYHAKVSDWVLDATNTEPVGGGCNPEEEIRKATEAQQQAAAKARTPGEGM